MLDSLSDSLKTGQIRFEDKSVYSHNLPRHLHCRTDYELRRRIPAWLKLKFLWYVRLASGRLAQPKLAFQLIQLPPTGT